ncbi:valyl-tRNA synthetase [Dongia mobilis]|uniref:Valine--tRNA ligase n=1 Tax=Dongia mobilis TaxID=578943 RepID=A0A4R6WPZ6_9PROT|nr:valine--tRNA ligase [Dongia mobilis]TDQ81320.1 valyl-tRNA synthetase [Dongia mobilis]
MLEKTFQPAEVEKKHYDAWEKAGAFAAHPTSNKAPYTIMMPPPNVTGSLHMGHALTFTLQDILIRYQRMKGRDALWQPGTDHAGIATQMVVERQLGEKGFKRTDLGRERFLEKVWEWKAESGGTITRQLRRLGASPDWPRERFTMDEGLNNAVRKVFVELYRQGLIYRDKRLVNWDPKLHTAISDLEVVQKEHKGHLWHFKYPVEGQEGRYLTVATTRPETMLGDTAVAVNAEDARYQDLIGKHLVLPLVGRRIPVVADDHADPETGSGAVKITPAHDFNDFEVGRRHSLEMINIFDKDARLNENVPEAYRGLDRYEARKRVVADLEALGLVEKIDDHTLMLPYGDRSGVVIEPWLTDQWYCDAHTLAQPAIKAVEEGRTVFVPKQWENTYFDWMRNIQPWCISRQLWWGHQIPAWYGPDGEVFVAADEAEAKEVADKHYGKAVELNRDPDVLDTWFSSALWPFSTLGWPEQTPELARYYPGDVLVTGFDIIFFWVARMMMMGMHFMGDVPFRTVYIHALVRDEHGQKMSKSKGNVIDPLDLIDKYGCDALRFTLTALAAQGRDIKMSENRVEGYRNFATKLWNATRFCLMNECRADPAFDPARVKAPVNRWMIGRLAACAQNVDQAMAQYRYNDAAAALYRCIWNEFCDWYVEFTKPIIQGEDEDLKAETRACTAWVLGQLLHLLHPFMPYITEELWPQLGAANTSLLITEPWPDFGTLNVDAEAGADLDWVIRLVSEIRTLRAEMNVPPGPQIPVLIRDAGARTLARLRAYDDLIRRLGRIEKIDVLAGDGPKGAAQIVIDEATVLLPLAGLIDVEKERARLTKDLDKASAEGEKIAKKLANAQFVAKADPAVVEEQRQRLAEIEQMRQKLNLALERLAGL